MINKKLDKTKFAIKASLAVMLAYIIPMYMGWEQGQTAAITIMIIAAAGSVSGSMTLGFYRVIGTVIGATVGMTLIAIFPQEREYYLMALSLFVIFFLYLARAYKGDQTVFMISAITMMLVFKNGEVDDIFIYGIDRTFMTIFGITLYTLICIFLWPVKEEDKSTDNAIETLNAQYELYKNKNSREDERKKLHKVLIDTEQKLISTYANTDALQEIGLSKLQWHSIMSNYRDITETLTLLALHDEDAFSNNYEKYVDGYTLAEENIDELFKTINFAWSQNRKIEVPNEWDIKYNYETLDTLTNLDVAVVTSTIAEMKRLHTRLISLAKKLNAMTSPLPTHFEIKKSIKVSNFNWFDIEDIKSTIVSYLIFWTTIFMWIYLNPPGGFLIVTLATALSLVTTFSPVKPSILIKVFTISFIFSAIMYMFVLPNLKYGLELSIFLFAYSFIGFFFIPQKISVFFLLGMATLMIDNPMSYNFDLFLILLLVFYMFLFVLLLFYYIPFSTKPEHLFLTMKSRFFKLSAMMAHKGNRLRQNELLNSNKMFSNYSEKHIMSTVKKMQLWASQIDVKYFSTIDKALLLQFTKESETFVYLLKMMRHRDEELKENRLINSFAKENQGKSLEDVLNSFTTNENSEEFNNIWSNKEKFTEEIEDVLKEFSKSIDINEHKQDELLEFYESISLRRNVWISLFKCKSIMDKLDFNSLKTSRF